MSHLAEDPADEPDGAPRRCRRVFALTGGIASGKSTVAAVFREQGLRVIDADVLARQVVMPGSDGLLEIVAAFGEDVCDEGGALSRSRLGALVFQSPDARERLNAIVHPKVRAAATSAFAQAFAEGEPLVCYEVPLLFETRQEERYRPVVSVIAPPEVQIARICHRDSLSREEAQARLAAQVSNAERRRGSDLVIENAGDKMELRERALQVLAEVRARA